MSEQKTSVPGNTPPKSEDAPDAVPPLVTPPPSKDTEVEKLRIERAYQLGMGGLIAVILFALGIAILSIFGLGNEQVTALSGVISPFLTLVGTLVGTFFGVQVGSAGKQELTQQVEKANDKATALAASLSPDKVTDFLKTFNDLSSR